MLNNLFKQYNFLFQLSINVFLFVNSEYISKLTLYSCIILMGVFFFSLGPTIPIIMCTCDFFSDDYACLDDPIRCLPTRCTCFIDAVSYYYLLIDI